MPHLVLQGQNLDNAYPPLAVPEEEELPDLVQDKDDAVFQRGLEEAALISREARDQGRKRKMSPNVTPSGSCAAKETVEDEMDLVNSENEARGKDVATTRSPLGRRRSEKLLPSQDSSQDGPKERQLEGSRMENPAEDESEKPSYSSVPVSALSFASLSDVCSYDLYRLGQAVLPSIDHLDYTSHF